MNNDIKEILEQLEWYRKIGKKDVFYPEYVLSNKKAFMLLDYITNLQERLDRIDLVNCKLRKDNERLKQYIDFYEDLTKQQINMINDYKSRIDKAIEEKKIPEKLKLSKTRQQAIIILEMKMEQSVV